MIEVRINIEYKGQAISLSQMFGRAKDVKSLWESAKVIDGMVVEMLKRAENYLSGVFVGLILFVLGLVNIVPIFYITSFVLLFYLPIIFYNFIDRKKYFKIYVT